MDDHFISTYAMEVRSQCTFAINAIGSLNFALNQPPETRADHEKRKFFHQEVFRAIHSFLTHASNVSRIFWPPVPSRRHAETNEKYVARIGTLNRFQRGTALREAFKLEDTSPLRLRTLRDHLEHFDERLDHWRDSSKNRNLVNDFVGPLNAIAGIEATDMFRCFDPAAKSFVFRGESFDLQELATEVGRVRVLAEQLEERIWAKRARRGA